MEKDSFHCKCEIEKMMVGVSGGRGLDGLPFPLELRVVFLKHDFSRMAAPLLILLTRGYHNLSLQFHKPRRK